MSNTYDVTDYGYRSELETEYDFDPYSEEDAADDNEDTAELAYWQFYCGVCDESPCVSPDECKREHELYVIHMRQTV